MLPRQSNGSRESRGCQHGGWICSLAKSIPHRHSQGDTFEEAIENITEAVELYLESLIADNQPIPKEDLIVKPLSVFV